jgi:hypothetical protein
VLISWCKFSFIFKFTNLIFVFQIKLVLFKETFQENQKAGGGVVGEEDIEVLELDFSKALEMIKSGEIRDAKMIMLLQYLQIEGAMN